MAPRTAIRSAFIAALAAALWGCTSPPPEQKAPEATPPAPQAATPPPARTAQAPVAVQIETPPQPAPKPRAPAKKRAPKPKPAPVAAAPAPPPAPPAPNPDEERARKRNAYIAALERSTVAFNPPSPVQMGQRSEVPLSVSPPKETAQLADDLRKSLADPASWTPRMRAKLAGNDFAIDPAEGKGFDGAKDLAASGPTEWRWTIVPQAPGSKKLAAGLSYTLPPGMGGPRDLPPLQRPVEVEATLAWRAERLWADYWTWIVAAVVVVAGIAWWASRR